MDLFGRDQEDGLRTRSFRNEDYSNRRVFLRSYPLHWGAEDKNETKEVPTKSSVRFKKPVKEILLSILEWGEGRAIVLRRFKHKVIACYAIGFKNPKALISARSM